jgi:hypothetical protein
MHLIRLVHCTIPMGMNQGPWQQIVLACGVQSFECIKYGMNTLARLGDRCWPATVASAGTWLLPMAALLLAAPMGNQLQV